MHRRQAGKKCGYVCVIYRQNPLVSSMSRFKRSCGGFRTWWMHWTKINQREALSQVRLALFLSLSIEHTFYRKLKLTHSKYKCSRFNVYMTLFPQVFQSLVFRKRRYVYIAQQSSDFLSHILESNLSVTVGVRYVIHLQTLAKLLPLSWEYFWSVGVRFSAPTSSTSPPLWGQSAPVCAPPARPQPHSASPTSHRPSPARRPQSCPAQWQSQRKRLLNPHLIPYPPSYPSCPFTNSVLWSFHSLLYNAVLWSEYPR